MSRDKLYSDDPLAQLDNAERAPAAGAGRLLAWLPVFVAMGALLLLLGWGLFREQGGVNSFGTNDGPLLVESVQKPAADFGGALYGPFRDQETLELSDLRGEVVVVNFWAAWCPPCRDEAPLLEEAWREYADQGVVFLGVDIWDTEQNARAYLDEFGVTFPNLIDERGRIAVEYGLTGVPETYFITGDGTISSRIIGVVTRATLAQGIEEALSAEAASAASN